VKIVGETSARDNFVLLGVRTDLVRVHANHGYLDRPSKIEIVVAQVIG